MIDHLDYVLEPARRAKRMALRGPKVETRSPSKRAVKRLDDARARYEIATIRAEKAKRGTIVERRIRKRDAMTELLAAETGKRIRARQLPLGVG